MVWSFSGPRTETNEKGDSDVIQKKHVFRKRNGCSWVVSSVKALSVFWKGLEKSADGISACVQPVGQTFTITRHGEEESTGKVFRERKHHPASSLLHALY